MFLYRHTYENNIQYACNASNIHISSTTVDEEISPAQKLRMKRGSFHSARANEDQGM